MRLRWTELIVPLSLFTLSCSGGNFNGGTGQGLTPPGGNSGSESTIPNGGSSDGEPAPLPPVDKVAELKNRCAKAPEASFKVAEQTLSFPERKTCTFGMNSNMARKDAFLQASELSAGTLTLPAGEICGIDVDSPADARLHYDDFLILSIDQRVVFMSNSGLKDYLDAPQQGIFTWDFMKVVGQPIKNFEAASYCLGQGSACVLPGHDKEGPVRLHLTANEIAPIAAAISGKGTVAMDLTATGDNDDTDCYHTALTVKVKIKYLP